MKRKGYYIVNLRSMTGDTLMTYRRYNLHDAFSLVGALIHIPDSTVTMTYVGH